MAHEVIVATLRRIFQLFYPNMKVGVKYFNRDGDEIIGVWFNQHKGIHTIEYCMDTFDPEWEFWTDENGYWGATRFDGDGNPQNGSEVEYLFEEKVFYKAQDKLLDILLKDFKDDLDSLSESFDIG